MRKAKQAVLLLVLAMASAAFAHTYIVQMATVRGSDNAMGPVCVANSVYQPGETVVWQAEVYQADGGERLTADQIQQLGISLKVAIDNGENVTLYYGGHPPDAAKDKQEQFWTGAWSIPSDGATGTYTWTLTVSDNQGHTDTFTPIGQGVGLNQLTVASPNG